MESPEKELMMQADSRPRVLMIGADRYAMEACLRLEIDAVVICSAQSWDAGLIHVPGRLIRVRVEDQTNPEHIVAALCRAGLAEDGFDAVHTSIEWALTTASLLAAHFGCRTMGPVTAVRFRDKSLQKARVSAAGVKTARITVIEDVYDVSAFDELPYERAVLKPIAGAATSRTSVIASLEDLEARSRQYAAERSAQRVFALEEFVGGEEWIVDGVVFDGELVFAGVGAYRDPCLTTVDKDLPLSVRRFDPDQDADAYALALPTATAALSALGLRDGVFHMELFHDADTGELYFGECAARRGGGLIHEEIQAKFNVHLGACALECALGRRPQLDVKLRPGVVVSGFLPGRPGTLLKCPTPAELRERPGVEFVRIEMPYGSLIEEGIGSTNQRIGMALVTGETHEEANLRLADVRAWFDECLVLVPTSPRQRELREWQAATWPDEDFGDVLWT